MSGYLQPRLAGGAPATRRTAEVRFARPRAAGAPLSYHLLLLFLILLYANPALLVPALDAIRPAQLVGGAALLVLFVELSLSRRSFGLVWPEGYLLLGLLGAAGLSCFGAIWMRLAVETTVDLVKIVLIFFLIINSVDSESRLRRAILVMVIGGLFPALGALYNYANGVVIEGRAGWIGIFANPNELAYSLIILLPLAAALAAESRFSLRLTIWGIMALYTAAIFVSFSRGGMIGLFIVVALLVLRQRAASNKVLMLGLLAAGLVFIAFFWSRGEGFSNIGQDMAFRQRMATIEAGLAMFADRPLFGVGLGCSVVAWPLYAPPDLDFKGWLANHNTFMQPLSEVGLIGFIFFVSFLAAAIYHARKTAGSRALSSVRPTHQFAAALEISLWGFMVCGLSGGYAMSWFPYILIGIISSAKKISKRSGD